MDDGLSVFHGFHSRNSRGQFVPLQGRVLSIMVETLMDFVGTQGNREKLDGGLGDLATGYKEAESIEDLWYRMRKYGETSPYPVWRKVFLLLSNSKIYANQRRVLSSKLINDIKFNHYRNFKIIVLENSKKYEIKEKRILCKGFYQIIRHSACIPDGLEESSFPDRENTNGHFYHQLSPKIDLTVDGEPTIPCRSSFVSSINTHDDIEEQSSTCTIEKAEAFDVFSPRVYQRERGEKLGYDTEQLGRFYESSSSAATPRWGYPRS
ncbi:hypothetical protein V1478_012695, partial [Vespula squamosa]